MPNPWYPLTFEPVYKDYIWGGQRLAAQYGRLNLPRRCAESWECSTRPEGMSMVRSGCWAGRSLAELIRADAAGLLGTAAPGHDFPLLVKLIDAHARLSVQVHPNDANASAVGGEPKTEAWIVLAAEPGAHLIHGFTPEATRDRLRRALTQAPAAMLHLLRRQMVTAGDVVFVPGGTVHAIGAGILLLEVQQNSNTTFRLYDWDRLGNDGRPRELHVDQALAVIDWERTGEPGATLRPAADPAMPANVFRPRVECHCFILEQARLTRTLDIDNDGAGFHGLFGAGGGFTVATDHDTVTVAAGSTVLLPAAIRRYTLQPLAPAGDGQIIRFRLPPR